MSGQNDRQTHRHAQLDLEIDRVVAVARSPSDVNAIVCTSSFVDDVMFSHIPPLMGQIQIQAIGE